MEVQWTSEAVEAKAQEMIVMWEPHCTTAMETVLANHLARIAAASRRPLGSPGGRIGPGNPRRSSRRPSVP